MQILHLGPYDDEGPTLARLHDEFLPVNGLVPTGRHHEIYLSDARKTEPAKLKTILRQPVIDGPLTQSRYRAKGSSVCTPVRPSRSPARRMMPTRRIPSRSMTASEAWLSTR